MLHNFSASSELEQNGNARPILYAWGSAKVEDLQRTIDLLGRDAIALHTSVGIASRKRPEIALVHIGAGVDVVGLELDKLRPELVAQTIEALPRHDFNKAFFSILVDTIAQAPQSAAMTWMCETANEFVPGCHCPTFAEKMKTSPFRESRLLTPQTGDKRLPHRINKEIKSNDILELRRREQSAG